MPRSSRLLLAGLFPFCATRNAAARTQTSGENIPESRFRPVLSEAIFRGGLEPPPDRFLSLDSAPSARLNHLPPGSALHASLKSIQEHLLGLTLRGDECAAGAVSLAHDA